VNCSKSASDTRISFKSSLGSMNNLKEGVTRGEWHGIYRPESSQQNKK
jgi:hypothetical protein